MKAILSVDINWGIGFDGGLLQRVPGDMQHFKRLTIGKVVVMGRKTFESLPKKSPLKDRVNIVLTRDKCFADDRLIVLNSLDEVLEEVKKYKEEDIFIIGGEQIFKLFLPYCQKAIITKFYKDYKADTFFPNLDDDENWKLTWYGEEYEYKGLTYRFKEYKNNALEVSK